MATTATALLSLPWVRVRVFMSYIYCEKCAKAPYIGTLASMNTYGPCGTGFGSWRRVQV